MDSNWQEPYHLMLIRQQDLFTTDLSSATVKGRRTAVSQHPFQ
jgi:hypothetical protein